MEYHEPTKGQVSCNQRAVGKDEPVMVAWTAFQKTEQYANCLLWSGKHSKGELWAAFSAGFAAARSGDHHGE